MTMATEIHSIIHGFSGGAAAVTIGTAAGTEFEMWLLLRIAAGLARPPFDAELRDATDTRLTPSAIFRLRGKPGQMGAGAACHVHFEWYGVPHEIHANTQFRGRSDQTHEIDIAVIPQTIAGSLRALGGGRPTGLPRISLECKYMNATGQKDEARQVVARLFDLAFLVQHPDPWRGSKPYIWPDRFPRSGFGGARVTYRQSLERCFSALCRLGGVTAPTGRYLKFNSVTPYHDLIPGSVEIRTFIRNIVKFLQTHRP